MILNKRTGSLFILLASLLVFAGCRKDEPAVSTLPDHHTALTQRLMDSTHLMATVFSDTSFEVTPGVEETDIHYLNMQGYTTRMFILKVDLNDPGIHLQVATPYDAPAFTLQTVPDMAEYVDEEGHYVMAGVNGGFFNTSTNGLMGIEYKNGVAIKDAFSDNTDKPQQGLSFFAILSDGTPYIGERGKDLDSMHLSIKEATGGGVLLVKNHQVMPPMVPTVAPRTAVGYTEDNIVYFIVVDGRDFFYSNGIDYSQLSVFMAALGVKNAINLDGGGSSILMIRSPLADAWQVRNQPSDGAPRAIANAWIVVADKK